MNKRIITAIVAYSILSLIIGILSNLVNIELSQEFVVIGLIITFIISIPLTIYLTRTNDQTDKEIVHTDNTSEVRISTLPARQYFLGRQEEVGRVLEGLASHYPFVVVQGPSGIGKTSLAREVAWRIQERDPKNIGIFPYISFVWIDNIHKDTPLSILLEKIHLALGNNESTSYNVINTIIQLQRYPCLLIFDDVDPNNEEVVNFLKKIPAPKSKAIITTSNKSFDFGGWIVELEKLSEEDTALLVEKEFIRTNKKRLFQDADLLAEKVVTHSLGIPYVAKLIVSQIAHDNLNDIFQNISTDDRLEQIWGELAKDSELLLLAYQISHFQSPPTLRDLNYLYEDEEGKLADLLKKLESLYVLETIFDEKHQYSMPSRTKTYLREKSKTETLHVMESLSLWGKKFVVENGGTKNWEGYLRLDEQFGTISELTFWLSAQESSQLNELAFFIWQKIDHYLSVKGDLEGYLKIGKHLYEMAERNHWDQQMAEINLEIFGYVNLMYARNEKSSSPQKTMYLDLAEKQLTRSLEFYKKVNDLMKISTAYRFLGDISRERKEISKAEKYYSESMKNYEEVTDFDNLGAVLNSLGVLEKDKGNFENSYNYQNRRLGLAKALNNPEGQAVSYYNLARLSQTQNFEFQAYSQHQEALKFAQISNRTDIMAAAQMRMGIIARQRGSLDKSVKLLKQAYDLYEYLGYIPDELQEHLDFFDKLDQNIAIMIYWKLKSAFITSWKTPSLRR